MTYDLTLFPSLSRDINWGTVIGRFTPEIEKDESCISNISIIPTVGERYAVIQLDNGKWELAGGTLEPNEHYMDALRREVMEELGAELLSYQLFGCFKCRSLSPVPYRPHIPHPNFVRLIGFGEVSMIGTPLNPPDGEQVANVEIVTIEEAVGRFHSTGRYDIAEMYTLAHYVRTGQHYF